MHIFTHVRESMRGQSGMPGNEYADGMIEMDMNVGKLLKALDDLGIANNTIVVFTTDNGPNAFSWPDAATTPFRSREGHQLGRRVPRAGDGPLAGPCQGRRGLQRDGLGSRLVPDAARRRGRSGVKDRLLKGWQPQGGPTTFRNHLDGYNQLDYLTGKSRQERAQRVLLLQRRRRSRGHALRATGRCVFEEQRAAGRFDVWANPFTPLRVPKMFNLRMDPYEHADIVSDQRLRLAGRERLHDRSRGR